MSVLAPTVEAKALPAQKVDSASHPITGISADVALSSELVSIADEACANFLKQMRVKELKGVKFLVYSLPEAGPGGTVPYEFPRKLRIVDGRPCFVVETQGNPAKIKESLVRSLTTVYLQALAWQGVEFPRSGELAAPPYWLVEGLTQEVFPGRHEDWAKVVWRLNLAGKIPDLQTIQGWNFPGEELPERLERKAVCYWLAKNALDNSVESQTLMLWLQEHREKGGIYWEETPDAENWWKETASIPGKPDLPLYSWEQTAVRLQEALSFSAIMFNGERRLLNVVRLPKSQDAFRNLGDVQAVEDKLVLVELQGHWMLAGVTASYRQALSDWRKGKYATYQNDIRDAQELQERVEYLRNSAGELLDWVTANFPVELDDKTAGEDGMAGSYGKLIGQLEEARYQLRKKGQAVEAP